MLAFTGEVNCVPLGPSLSPDDIIIAAGEDLPTGLSIGN